MTGPTGPRQSHQACFNSASLLCKYINECVCVCVCVCACHSLESLTNGSGMLRDAIPKGGCVCVRECD